MQMTSEQKVAIVINDSLSVKSSIEQHWIPHFAANKNAATDPILNRADNEWVK